jgi:hypothetical protein
MERPVVEQLEAVCARQVSWQLLMRRVRDYSRWSIHRALLSARFASIIPAKRGAAAFVFSHGSWVQLWLLRARRMAAMASTVRGMSAVCRKKGSGPDLVEQFSGGCGMRSFWNLVSVSSWGHEIEYKLHEMR